MWFEKRLIYFAGNGDGPLEVTPLVEPTEGKEGAKDTVRRGTENSLGMHGERVAKTASEGSEQIKGPFDGVKDFEQRLIDVRSQFSNLEKLGLKERAEAIISIRRRIMEVKFLIRYLSETEYVEVVNSHSVYVEGEKNKIDLTAVSGEIKGLEEKLVVIKAQDEKKEVFLYADLEKTRNTIKPRDFLKLPLADRLLLISNVKSWDELKEEKLIVFNFGSNRALEYQIGLGDLMPPEIRKISMGGSVYERRANQGFFNHGKYLAILGGSKVKIEDVQKDAVAKNEAEYVRKFSNTYKVDEKLPSRELPRVDVLSIAKSFGVDAYFLEAVLNVVSGDAANGIDDDYEFLHIAARYIQNAEARFGSESMESGHYSVRFLAFAMDRFNLFGENSGKNPNLKKIVEKYAAMRKIELKVDEKVEAAREAERPRTVREMEKAGGRAKYQGEIAYQAVDLSHGSEDMKRRMESRLTALRAKLTAHGVPEKYHTSVLAKARAVYEMMIGRMGTAYHSTVGIRKPDGSLWNINNNCVGGAMKNMENTGFQILRGRQRGKQAANFYWGTYGDGKRDFHGYAWLRSMIPDDSYMVRAHVTPENCDALIGQHLATGECAPAGLWNHAFWIYKDYNGTVMICHSGADVRPKRIKAEGEMPPGYTKVGGWYVKNRGSKLNEVPLSYFLARTQGNYAPPRNGLSFVPLTKLFMGNLEGQPMV